MSILRMCEEYFGTRDVYKLFDVEKNAAEKDIKKAYYKLSLEVHPDRVPESQKQTATEKFKLLSNLYQILSDKDKRAVYDENGIIYDNDDDIHENWLDFWKNLFKPLTEEDITNYEKSYVGSDLEKTDIKKAYINGKGCINYMINSIPFMKVADEPRMQEIVGELIATGEVPEYKIFTQEPKQKRKRRHDKYARESKKAEEIKAKMKAKNEKRSAAGDTPSTSGNLSLEQAIIARKHSRESSFSSLIEKLMEKYGDEEDDVSDVPPYKKLKPEKKSQKKRK